MTVHRVSIRSELPTIMSHITTKQSNEGPSQSGGGIVRSVSPATMAEQFSEGPGPRPGGIAGSAIHKRGVKRKLDAKALETSVF